MAAIHFCSSVFVCMCMSGNLKTAEHIMHLLSFGLMIWLYVAGARCEYHTQTHITQTYREDRYNIRGLRCSKPNIFHLSHIIIRQNASYLLRSKNPARRTIEKLKRCYSLTHSHTPALPFGSISIDISKFCSLSVLLCDVKRHLQQWHRSLSVCVCVY